MKKQNQCVNGRFVSVEKIQQMFANLGFELCSGHQHIRAKLGENSIVFYTNGGTVNISFNEKGGKK